MLLIDLRQPYLAWVLVHHHALLVPVQEGVEVRLVLDAGVTSCVKRQGTAAVIGRTCVTRGSRAGWRRLSQVQRHISTQDLRHW